MEFQITESVITSRWTVFCRNFITDDPKFFFYSWWLLHQLFTYLFYLHELLLINGGNLSFLALLEVDYTLTLSCFTDSASGFSLTTTCHGSSILVSELFLSQVGLSIQHMQIIFITISTYITVLYSEMITTLAPSNPCILKTSSYKIATDINNYLHHNSAAFYYWHEMSSFSCSSSPFFQP